MLPMDLKLIPFLVKEIGWGCSPQKQNVARATVLLQSNSASWMRLAGDSFHMLSHLDCLDSFLVCIFLCAAIKPRCTIVNKANMKQPHKNRIDQSYRREISLPSHTKLLSVLLRVFRLCVASSFSWCLGTAHVSGELLLYASPARLPLRSGVR